MKLNISKYAFNTKEQFEEKLDALHTMDEEGNNIPDFKFSVVQIGNIELEAEVLDEKGEVESKAVFSEKWHVDVAWFEQDEHPYGWKSYKVDFEEGQGMHSFAGVDYQSHKF
jgi:hypothetical protein